jgi:hypothetical protein
MSENFGEFSLKTISRVLVGPLLKCRASLFHVPRAETVGVEK